MMKGKVAVKIMCMGNVMREGHFRENYIFRLNNFKKKLKNFSKRHSVIY